jgi:hypothetical protein
MENGKIYTLSSPTKAPWDSDVNIVDTTTSRVSFSKSRIIFISQTDRWDSPTHKSKEVLKWIYDGSFSFNGITLSTIKLANINQITFSGHGLGYDPTTSASQYSREGAGAFRFATPYKNLNVALTDTVNGDLLYNYSSTGESMLAPYLGGWRFRSASATTDRTVIPGDLSKSELKLNWWVDPFSSSSSSGTATITNSLATKTGPDTLTGVVKKKDLFDFQSKPEYGSNTDRITNFSTKDKDQLQFSKSAFGVSRGKFAIAKDTKNLNKLLVSDTNFIYNQPKGELIFNANGVQSGFGENGGVFAILVGKPSLTGSSVSFV